MLSETEVAIIGSVVREALAPLEARLAAIEARPPADVKLDVQLDADQRTLIFNGRQKITLPNPVYRQVWSKDCEYHADDLVTYGGSIWIALESNFGSRPGQSNKSWKLAVKRGRDGR